MPQNASDGPSNPAAASGRNGDTLITAWGGIYAAWAGLKVLSGLTPTMCEAPPIAGYATFLAVCELAIGIAVCIRSTRRLATIAGAALNVGLIPVAFIAHARKLPWDGCGCVFVGVEFPWLPGHAILAGALALPFVVIVALDERRLRRLRDGKGTGLGS